MAKKAFKFEDYWAQHIIRALVGKDEKICAYVRRRFSDDDVDQSDPGKYIGLVKEDIVEKIVDSDPDSETFGERIPKPDAEPTGLKYKFIDNFNTENIKNYKKLIGLTNAGRTEFIYKFRDLSFTCEDEEEFWEKSLSEIRKIYTGKKQVVEVVSPSGKIAKN